MKKYILIVFLTVFAFQPTLIFAENNDYEKKARCDSKAAKGAINLIAEADQKNIDKAIKNAHYPNRHACDAAAAFASTGGAIIAGVAIVATGTGAALPYTGMVATASCSCAKHYKGDMERHGKTTIKIMSNYDKKVDVFLEKAGCAAVKFSGHVPFATVCFAKANLDKHKIVNYRPWHGLPQGRVTAYVAHKGKNIHKCHFHMESAEHQQTKYVYITKSGHCNTHDKAKFRQFE